MLAFALTIGFLSFGIASMMALWRLIKGPDNTDRLLSLDTLYVNAMGLLTLVAIKDMADGRSLYFEVALLIAVMGFVGTVAGARFLARGDAIE
ncbi:MAG: K+/H+ antiporter subunit F [Burkholderiaceae bacterium]